VKTSILFVTTNLDKGGAEEITLTYARQLDRSRFTVTVVCLHGGVISEEIGAIPGVSVIEVRTRSRIGRFLRILGIARRVKADVIHNQACWYGLLVGALVRARRVETIQNLYQWLNWHERLRYGLYLRLADRIIAVSAAVSDFTREFFPFVPASRMLVIFNSIDVSRFHRSRGEEDIREYGLEGRMVIGFLGRLTEQKGLPYLLSAAAEIGRLYPEVLFMIVGDGDLGPQLREQAGRERLTNVVFAGYQRDVPRFLSLFDVFVLPSLWEGLPVAVVEAMAAGKPVVATRVGGTPEAVVDGTTGYIVEPRSVPQLVGRLGDLIRNPELRRRLGRAGRERVMEYFSASTMVKRTEELYLDLVKKS
jgi:glycosyltransferase involved in cell wall biosynthesis